MAKKIFGVPNLTGPVAIGIDQSYSGFAITAIDKKDHFYTEVYKVDGNGIERLHNAKNFMLDFLDTFDVYQIAMEGYAYGSQMANMAGELGGMIKLALYEHYRFKNNKAAFPIIVAPTSLKKYITGKGNGVAKNQILLAVYKKWDVEFTDDNAADSYGLARLATGRHDFEYEKEVYEKVTSRL